MEEIGLKMSRDKTDYLTFNEEIATDIKQQGTKLTQAEKFKYLGSIVIEDGKLEAEISIRIQCGSLNWKKYLRSYVTSAYQITTRARYTRLWYNLYCCMGQKHGP